MQSEGQDRLESGRSRRFERWLVFIFLASLPLMNPWVRGDGIGYYALARAPLIEHSLDFVRDYQSGNASFRDARIDENGVPRPSFRTPTGHLDNHFTVGPAILWGPFLLIAHAGVLLARVMGSHVAADGFSAPYRFAMAFGTALYGFVGLLLANRLASKYVDGCSAFLATICIWWSSSLPVYMYFNPSWSHAHSAFTVALFLWYWHQTRVQRTTRQWCFLAVIAGLVLNVYYANVTVLIVLLVEAVGQYLAAFRSRAPVEGSSMNPSSGSISVARLVANHLLFGVILILCFLPTFITRYVIYGSPLESGYIPLSDWAWRSPYFFSVLFSSDHGLFVWTPVVILAVAGLLVFRRRQPDAHPGARVGGDRPDREIADHPGRAVLLGGKVLHPSACQHLAAAVPAAAPRFLGGDQRFADLRRLVGWAGEHGAGFVLLNPLHAPATGPVPEPSPYFPSSRCFLNPLYIRVEEVPGAGDLAGIEFGVQRNAREDAELGARIEAVGSKAALA